MHILCMSSRGSVRPVGPAVSREGNGGVHVPLHHVPFTKTSGSLRIHSHVTLRPLLPEPEASLRRATPRLPVRRPHC
jgi:hypothetical protein